MRSDSALDRRLQYWYAVKAVLLVGVGLLLVPAAFFEAASQFPTGKTSPIQLPILTTSSVLHLDAKLRVQLARDQRPLSKGDDWVSQAAMRLREEPLDPSALWLWSKGQKPEVAVKALEVANKVSRRERSVQFDLMRIRALSGDLPESFVHLDNALTVWPRAAPEVLLGLVMGLDDPRVLSHLKPYGHRRWYKILLEQSVSQGSKPEVAAQLLLQTNLTAEQLPEGILQKVVGRLVQLENMREAKKLVRRYTGIGEEDLDNFALTESTLRTDSSPLTWALSNDSTVSSAVISGGVSFEVEPGGRSRLMHRVTEFRPGNYTLVQSVRSSAEEVQVKWIMRCIRKEGPTESWSQLVPVSKYRERYQSVVLVRPDCRIQHWELVMSNSSISGVVTLDLTSLDMVRNPFK